MSGPLPDLAVESVTGVDVSLALAGPGARSYAFVLDWHIRLILALCWYALAALIYNGRLSLQAPATAHARWFGLVLIPAAAIYFLYHFVLELAMRGRTPGKRMAGVHIVARDGSAPSAGALLTRNVFRLIDSLPVCYGVGLLAVASTREHLRVGDMAAGTLLAYEQRSVAAPVQLAGQTRLDPGALELVQDLLARWTELAPEARLRLARSLIARYAPGESEAESEAALRAFLERLAGP